MTALAPETRLPVSQRKIRHPFELDPTMCFYSPQANLDALKHPRVAAWLEFITTGWTPPVVPGATTRLALLLPCTKYKPYVTSREHRGINAALLADGWRPVNREPLPPGLSAILEPEESEDLLQVGPLQRDGVVLDRFVISEPLALVPYPESMYHAGAQSPATSYDDPGLFESRGTSVSPERSDCSARMAADGSWRWGPAEREAYVAMHNAMSSHLVTALGRLAPDYAAITAWVSPGLTHRSFLADAALRADEGLPTTRKGSAGVLRLRGVLDALPGAVQVLPTRDQISAAQDALSQRLAATGRPSGTGSVRSVFARGDGHDTPLGLPELLEHLLAALNQAATNA
ncbi:MAG TPA: hypothetical protein DCM67_11435 [Propionibacteriaceae bacterium]|nr:hypothetical protein [Propionibacteriaceae bacterium]